MTNTHRIIYVAASRGQAYALKNLLAEHGIAAHVSNDFAGGDMPVGDLTSGANGPCVVVPEQDAEQAHRVLEETALAIERGLPSPELAQLEAEAGEDDEWPACPHCHRPRLTSCPVCETAGTHFAQAFMPDLGQDDAPAGEGQNPLLVLCPTCDEPFAPQFPALCEWCGHRFRDGYEPPPVNIDASPQFSSFELGSRVVIVALGLVAFAAALFGWFYYVLY